MNILILSQYFWPEHFLINDLASELSKKNNIYVVTGRPNYPSGEIYSGYEFNDLFFELKKKNIKICRVPNRPRKNANALSLFLNYLSFIYNVIKFRKKIINEFEFDLIYFFGTSPITSAIPGIILKKIKQKPLVLWVQDLWPGVLKSTGFIKNKFILNLINKIVIKIYQESDLILTQSQSFRDEIIKNIDSSKVIFFPNCMKSKRIIKPNKKEINNVLLKVLDSNFCFTFAGNIGKVQDYNSILYLAHNLIKIKNIAFVIIGFGSSYEKFKLDADKKKLTNIYFFEFIENKFIKFYLNKSKALLLNFYNDDVLNKTIPGKFQAYLEAAKPVIASANGEIKKIININKLGFCSSAGDYQQLKKNMLNFYNLRSNEIIEIENNCRNYFLENYELSIMTNKLQKILKKII